MGIGILYESKEWSSGYLEKCINAMGIPAKLIDLEADINENDLLSYKLVINRVCGSAGFRGHQKSLKRTPGIIALLEKNGVPMLNPYEAHFYETGKAHAAKTLAEHGFPVPKVYGVARPPGIIKNADIKYPCVVKPDCGGRSNCTFIVKNQARLCEFMKDAPDIEFIAEEYISPWYGYLTRIEVIGYACRLAVKRSLAENGLSSYNLGSTYAAYDDFPGRVKDASEAAARLLKIETGSFDIVENESGFYFIDTNSVSNASEDSNELFIKDFNFDLIAETAAYAAGKYRELSI